MYSKARVPLNKKGWKAFIYASASIFVLRTYLNAGTSSGGKSTVCRGCESTFTNVSGLESVAVSGDYLIRPSRVRQLQRGELRGMVRPLVSTMESPSLNFSCQCNNSFQTGYSQAIVSALEQWSDILLEDLQRSADRLGLHIVPNPAGIVNWIRPGPLNQYDGDLPARIKGYDIACGRSTVFESNSRWFRDHLISQACNTQPRERALAFVLSTLLGERFQADDITMHESSPNAHGLSAVLRNKLGANYIGTQYSPTVACGEVIPGRHELAVNLEDQCFNDSSFDVVVTQDVFEHVMHPEHAFQEIGRTLKPGGVHVFTVPTPSKTSPTFNALMEYNGTITLVNQWGYDIVDFISSVGDMKTVIVYLDSAALGVVDAEYREVFISFKKGGESKNGPILDSKNSCPSMTYICLTS